MRSRLKDSGAARVVSGTVLGAGTTFNGVGFTSAKTATGSYTVRFLTPFRGRPVTTVTPAQGGNAVAAYVSSEGADFSNIGTLVGSTPADLNFNFTTTGYD
jgi:predicted alpha/beta-fold hydrolase